MKIEAPVRISHVYDQILHAPPATVFSLLCPVKEAQWLEGWDPELVISDSGVAEPDCMFVTSENGTESVWVITRHDPGTMEIQMLKITPGLMVTQIRIRCIPAEENQTRCRIRYTFSAISEAGKEQVKRRDTQWYRVFMNQWEASMNRYLEKTGRMDRDR